ncbi:OPT oligopeptide transporter [Mycena floridula]|nr:OPT oligopeptide transporter [Mycena floridula]
MPFLATMDLFDLRFRSRCMFKSGHVQLWFSTTSYSPIEPTFIELAMDTESLYPESLSYTIAPSVRPRRVPDVPQDIDILEHFNDPNYDPNFDTTTLDSDFDGRSLNAATDIELQNRQTGPSEFTSTIVPSEGDTDDTDTIVKAKPLPVASAPPTVEYHDESPYPEVRAAVSSVDDPSMAVNTFRMWLIGIFVSIAVSALNQIFSMRSPGLFITGIVVQLISLPLGKLFALVLPKTQLTTFGYHWSLNPSPFTIKEHVCITVMANVSAGGAYATQVIATQKIFYNQQLSLPYELCLALGTQILGFSLGGLLRPFVVWPTQMIWPGALVNSALFNTLHGTFANRSSRLRDRGHISRERFFGIALACSFVWYFVPGYLFTALSLFNWACWIKPTDRRVNALFGTVTGLGMGVFTFDWAMISYIGSPLVTPWWSEANTIVAMIVLFWILCPIIYFTNTFFTAFLPISTYLAFDNTGAIYDPTAIVSAGVFDLAKYEAYSPVFLPASLCVAYGAAFAAFTAVIMHTFLWFRQDIARRSRMTRQNDVHSRLMLAYPEVPHWWYFIVGLVSFLLAVLALDLFPTQLPVWGLICAFLSAAVLAIPVAMIQAMTNQQIALQVFHEFIAGLVLPGRPTANMLWKTTAYIGTNQAVGFAGDLKLGHYMKIAPRIMFAAQVSAAVLSSVTTVIVQDLMLAHVEDICTPGQKHGFSCPSIETFATASLVWGGVGPKRLFSGIYQPLLWFLLIGFLLPVPFYILARRFPRSFFRYVNIPVCFASVGAIPPGSGINYAGWAVLGFIFNWGIRRFRFRWWMRFNYILSAALDAGVALAIIVIFFCIQMPRGGISLKWWGNTVWIETADAMGLPLLVSETPLFGPTAW